MSKDLLPCGHGTEQGAIHWGDFAFCSVCKRRFKWLPASWREVIAKRTLTQSEPSASS